MNLYSFILMLFIGNSVAVESVTRVHFLKNGVIEYGYVDPIKANLNNPSQYIVSTKKYNAAGNVSSNSIRINKKDLVFEADSITTKIQEQSVVLKKGMIVLTKDQKPAQVEAVFPDGKISLIPIEVNPMSRNRLKENKNFAPIKNKNIMLVDKSNITAVEQDCFLRKYCAGKAYKNIEGIPVCQANALHDAKNIGLVKCGRFGTQGGTIGAVFSDGTLLLHLTLIKPFPQSIHKYVPKSESATEVEN
jgi:hypothetical protein